MKVNLDPNAGFCFGVKRAINIAEDELKKHENLLCLGEIVHNDEEVKRLRRSGLQTLENKDFETQGKNKVMIRAHGEAPSIYVNADKHEIEIIDATCPVVLKLQKKIRQAYLDMKPVNGQVAIIGNKQHPEIVGLSGQTDNNAIIIETPADVDLIEFRSPLRLFIQTTKDKNTLDKTTALILQKYSSLGIQNPDFKHYDTICSQVSGRIPALEEFCRQNEVIIFVSGRSSSNGKHLFGICQSVNPRSYFVSSKNEIEKSWFKNANTVGISGATSTPAWQLEEIAALITRF